MGPTPPIAVTLTLIEANCNPILLSGLKAIKINKTELTSLSHPYNSVYMKLFKTFNKSVITLCQFYTGQLPLEYLLDIRTVAFYAKLKDSIFSPAGMLFNWFGKRESFSISEKYCILENDSPGCCKYKIKTSFINTANAMI